jgi:hypothetical protein
VGLAQSAGSKRFNPVGPSSILGEVMFARMIILEYGHVDTNDDSWVWPCKHER